MCGDVGSWGGLMRDFHKYERRVVTGTEIPRFWTLQRDSCCVRVHPISKARIRKAALRPQMPLRARRDAGKAGPRSLSRRALALISLLWPLRSSAFLLNLTFAPRHAILRSCCSQRSSIVGVAAGSWARPTRQLRRSTGRYPGASAAEAAAGERLRPVTVTAAAAKAGDDSGYTAKSEKVRAVGERGREGCVLGN